MLKIIFTDGTATNAHFKKIKDNAIQLIGDNVANLTGFKVYNPNNLFLGDYSAYTTKYNIYTDLDDGIVLSTGTTEPEPIPIPEPPTEATVAFVADDKCELDGDTELIVAIGTSVDDIDFPTVTVMDDKYEFTGWTPTIDSINSDVTFYANTNLKHEYTLEGRVDTHEEVLNNLLGVN